MPLLPPPPSTHSATVLVVTPDDELRDRARAMLHFCGYRTLAPLSPRDAVEQVGAHGVEAVLFDLDYGAFDPSTLLGPPHEEQDVHVSAEWLADRQDLRGARHLILTSRSRPTEEQQRVARSVGRSVTLVAQPLDLFALRCALEPFSKEHAPSPARPAGATGTMLAIPTREDVAPPAGYQDPRRGRHAAAIAQRGSEHRSDIRFEFSCGAVLLGASEERAQITELSRRGMRVRKTGRELNAGTHVEIAFVAYVAGPAEPRYLGVRALGQVVWTSEGATFIEAGITLHAVQPLPDYITVLVSLFGPRNRPPGD